MHPLIIQFLFNRHIGINGISYSSIPLSVLAMFLVLLNIFIGNICRDKQIKYIMEICGEKKGDYWHCISCHWTNAFIHYNMAVEYNLLVKIAAHSE